MERYHRCGFHLHLLFLCSSQFQPIVAVATYYFKHYSVKKHLWFSSEEVTQHPPNNTLHASERQKELGIHERLTDVSAICYNYMRH